jgi:hypothetical protein
MGVIVLGRYVTMMLIRAVNLGDFISILLFRTSDFSLLNIRLLSSAYRLRSFTFFYVTSLITGDGTYSFVLIGDGSDSGKEFRSSEHANAPVLRVTYE